MSTATIVFFCLCEFKAVHVRQCLRLLLILFCKVMVLNTGFGVPTLS